MRMENATALMSKIKVHLEKYVTNINYSYLLARIFPVLRFTSFNYDKTTKILGNLMSLLCLYLCCHKKNYRKLSQDLEPRS